MSRVWIMMKYKFFKWNYNLGFSERTKTWTKRALMRSIVSIVLLSSTTSCSLHYYRNPASTTLIVSIYKRLKLIFSGKESGAKSSTIESHTFQHQLTISLSSSRIGSHSSTPHRLLQVVIVHLQDLLVQIRLFESHLI